MTRSTLFWTPRLLGIWFVLFVSMFALDVFAEGLDWWAMAGAAAMHLMPAAAILALLLFACRWEAIGGALFIVVGVSYVVFFWGQFGWVNYLAIAGPPFLLGVMFLAHWWAYPARA